MDITTAKRMYQKLLRLYPRYYRERFGQELVQTFGDMYRDNPRRAWWQAGKDLLMSVPAQHAMEIQEVMQLNQKFANVPYATAGAVLIAPFSLLLVLAMLSQLFLHRQMSLQGVMSPQTVTILIIYCPLAAILINLVAVAKEMPGKRMGDIFSWQFVVRNVFSFAIGGLAVLAIAFIRLHDAAPCLVHHVLNFGWHNLGQTISICRKA